MTRLTIRSSPPGCNGAYDCGVGPCEAGPLADVMSSPRERASARRRSSSSSWTGLVAASAVVLGEAAAGGEMGSGAGSETEAGCETDDVEGCTVKVSPFRTMSASLAEGSRESGVGGKPLSTVQYSDCATFTASAIKSWTVACSSNKQFAAPPGPRSRRRMMMRHKLF